MYIMRFDMRSPIGAEDTTELYRTALEMCSWGEGRGAMMAALTEHHMSPDGYLPAPLMMASAIAARTTSLPIMIAIFQLPLYEPVRLAEEMSVLDHISRGRVSYIGGLGYLPHEYEMMGEEFRKRGAIADEKLGVLLKALKGEPFEHAGRRIHVTPRPYTPGGPSIGWGGGSVPAARRAGKHGLGFLGQRYEKALEEAYFAACRENGQTPGAFTAAKHEEPAVMFVAEDVDAAWQELGSYIMSDVVSYAEWNEGSTDTMSISFAKTAQDLREERRSHLILTPEEAVSYAQTGRPLMLHPLIGGIPSNLAWKYLKIVGEKVVPAIEREGGWAGSFHDANADG